MGRPKRTKGFSEEEKKIIGSYSDVSFQWEDVTNHDSSLGILTKKVFQKNTFYHRRKIFNRIKTLQCKPSHIISSNVISRKGRRYKKPFWAKRESYVICKDRRKGGHSKASDKQVKTKQSEDTHKNKNQQFPTNDDVNKRSEIQKRCETLTFEDSFRNFVKNECTLIDDTDVSITDQVELAEEPTFQQCEVTDNEKVEKNNDITTEQSNKLISDELFETDEIMHVECQKDVTVECNAPLKELPKDTIDESKSELDQKQSNDENSVLESNELNEEVYNLTDQAANSKNDIRDDKRSPKKKNPSKKTESSFSDNDVLQNKPNLKGACISDENHEKYIKEETTLSKTKGQPNFSFTISYTDEWKPIRPQKNDSKTKQILKRGWTDLMSNKFNEQIPGCVLSFRGHDITSGTKGSYFRATADCKHEDCGTFLFHIDKKPKRSLENIVNVSILRPYIQHSRESVKKRQLTGNRRRKLQESLEKEAASKYFYSILGKMNANQYSSGNDTECQNTSILKKAKSEWRLHDVLHKDPFTELCIMEGMFEYLDEESKTLKGYVQQICYKPFSTVLYTENSLTAAKEHIRIGGGVFHIDATGSVVHKVGQKIGKILYYALVLNTSGAYTESQTTLPVLEFLLERQSTPNIVSPLLMFFTALRKLSLYSKPKRVEVDFAWALIHSVLLTTNSTSIHQYMWYCFKVVTGTLKQEQMTVVHICSAHMLRAFRDAIREKVLDKGMRQFVLRIFALIQNTSVLTETKQLWIIICTALGTRKLTQDARDQTLALKDMVTKASIADLKHEFQCQKDSRDAEDDDFVVNQGKGIRESSPFKEVFDSIRTTYCKEDDDSQLPDNPYFQPDVIDILNRQYMPLVCLWSGLMLGNIRKHDGVLCASQITRDTNAAVESWMNIVKTNTLGKERSLRIGLFVKEEFKVVNGRLREYLSNVSAIKTPRNHSKNKPLDKETAEFAEESWQRPSEHKKKKSYFFSPVKECPQPKSSKTEQKLTMPKNNSIDDTAPVKKSKNRAKKDKDHTREMNMSNTPTWTDKTLPPGIQNQGNTCWLISSLQALAAVPNLNLTDKSDVTLSTRRVLSNIKERKTDDGSLDELKDAITRTLQNFVIGRQEDVAEFVHHILSLEPEFGVHVITTWNCFNCRKEKSTSDINVMLVTEIPWRKGVCIAACIEEFTKQEVVGVDGINLINCDRCQIGTKQLVKMEIPSGPRDFFVMQLKRFASTSKGARKVQRKIYVNRLLSLGAIIPRYYRLAAVQCHVGPSLSQGHYVTVIVSEDDDNIVRCDDQIVTKMKPEFLNSPLIQENCYLLYYHEIQVANPYQEEEPIKDPEMPSAIDSLLSMPSQEIVASHHNLNITAGDLSTLEDGMWVNDQIVNIYLAMLGDIEPDVGRVDTLFQPAVELSRNPENFFNEELWKRSSKIMIPVNRSSHWSLVVVDKEKRIIKTIDSRTHRNMAALIINFLQKQPWSPKDFTLRAYKEAPRQQNGDDCGIFMLQNAVAEAMGIPPTFTQEHIPSMRRAMMTEIVTGEIMAR